MGVESVRPTDPLALSVSGACCHKSVKKMGDSEEVSSEFLVLSNVTSFM